MFFNVLLFCFVLFCIILEENVDEAKRVEVFRLYSVDVVEGIWLNVLILEKNYFFTIFIETNTVPAVKMLQNK